MVVLRASFVRFRGHTQPWSTRQRLPSATQSRPWWVQRRIRTNRSPTWFLVRSTRSRRSASSRARSVSLDALKDGTEWELAYDEWSAEERALVDETYKVLMLHVSTWGTNNVRIVTEAYLEAAHLGEPPRAADVADELSSLTGNEVSEEEVRSWKSRGFKKLRAYVEARWAEEQE